MEGVFSCDAFGGQIAMIFEATRFRTRIVDAIFGIALATHESLQVRLQTVVHCRLVVDISNGLCCHLVNLFLTDEDAVSLLQVVLSILDRGGGLNFDVDFLMGLAVLAVELQPELAVFQGPDLSQDGLAIWTAHVLVLFHRWSLLVTPPGPAGGPKAAWVPRL